MEQARELVRVGLPTSFGAFDVRGFRCPSGLVYLAVVRGDIGAGRSVLARVHSACVTGDVLGSLRCDCGVQLRTALRRLSSEGRGVLVYAAGDEGRGIGIIDKLAAYVEQDDGADTVDANLRLGLPVDSRDYREAASVLAAVGVRSVRLLTNNPLKANGLEAAGVEVEAIEPIATSPHVRNLGYLDTKRRRLGHLEPTGLALAEPVLPAVDASALLGPIEPPDWRPYVVLKYAQTLDGRIATGTGDSKWISGEDERRVSHALRAACDAVLVGIGTVLRDDPQLTVRMVAGASPLRVVLDSSLRVPLGARVLDDEAPTLVLTTTRSSSAARQALRARHVGVRVLDAGPVGVDVTGSLAALRAAGVASLLVEGGSRVITAMLAAGMVDRLIAGVAPKIIGSGTEAVGDLGVVSVADGMRLVNRTVHVTPDDLLVAYDVEWAPGADVTPTAIRAPSVIA